MRDTFRWQILWLVLALASLGAVAPCASASITPTVSLDQSAGETAGSTASLGVDITFAPTGTDSPDLMTLNLPRGCLPTHRSTTGDASPAPTSPTPPARSGAER